eukprot:CCRYP_015871-RA/>CCRYP_015871-RA protein AED:0.25 eAED:0.25 QI:0/-1/0/1/-1/1/1/0/288
MHVTLKECRKIPKAKRWVHPVLPYQNVLHEGDQKSHFLLTRPSNQGVKRRLSLSSRPFYVYGRMQLNTTPAWVEDFDGTEIGDFVMRRPTSAPTSCTRSILDTSRVVHVIEPDDDDFITPHRARNASSREPSSSHSIARPAPKQRGTPRDSSKSRDEQAGRRPHSSSNKCSLPLDSSEKTPRRRGKKAGPSVLSTLDKLPVVSPPASNDNRDAKLRRSTRTKVKPLEFWNNERPIYGPHNEIGLLGEAMGNMPVVVGVQRKSGVKYFDRSQGVVTRNVVDGDASKRFP